MKYLNIPNPSKESGLGGLKSIDFVAVALKILVDIPQKMYNEIPYTTTNDLYTL